MATHAALKYVRQTCSISEVVSVGGVRRAADASHRLSVVTLCDVGLVLHLAAWRPTQVVGGRGVHFRGSGAAENV